MFKVGVMLRLARTATKTHPRPGAKPLRPHNDGCPCRAGFPHNPRHLMLALLNLHGSEHQNDQYRKSEEPIVSV